MAILNLDALRKALNEQAPSVFEDGRSTQYGVHIPCPECNRLTQWVEHDKKKTFTMHPCGHQAGAGTEIENVPIKSRPIASVGAMTWGRIADGPVESHSINIPANQMIAPASEITYRVPAIEVVAATLRMIAEQVSGESDRQLLLNTAQGVETSLDDACCPLCQEATCDTGCPLSAARAALLQSPR